MVRVYDGTGTTLVAEITCGEWNTPRLLLWHPVSNRVFCVTGCDSQIDTVLVIDCSTDSVTTRIPVGSMPSSICVNPVNDLVYVCSRYHVHALSPTGDSIIAVIPQPYDNSTHICAVPFANKMYVTRGNWVHVIDCDDHVVSESIATHSGTIICDTDRGRVYGASEPLPVYDARADTLLMTIPATGDEWGFVTWNRTDSRVYIVSTSNDRVLVVRDSTTAVAEPAAGPCLRDRPDATVCRGRLLLHTDAPASLLDLTGRRAAVLEPGSNDVRALKSGVYFVQPDNSAPTLKVIIQN
jgi:YVTN family beta-propeller protein